MASAVVRKKGNFRQRVACVAIMRLCYAFYSLITTTSYLLKSTCLQLSLVAGC